MPSKKKKKKKKQKKNIAVHSTCFMYVYCMMVWCNSSTDEIFKKKNPGSLKIKDREDLKMNALKKMLSNNIIRWSGYSCKNK